ncbi:MAG TPA: PilZ domain-containing protein [Burkholderiaceae bacterium]|jgi:hypothetical protein
MKPTYDTRPDAQRHRDQREYERVEFQLSPVVEHSGWMSQPKDAPRDALNAGLVMNLSQTGLQVMTSAEHPLTADHYEVRLLVNDDHDSIDYSGPVRRVWTRELGEPSQLSGFEFEHPDSPTSNFLQHHSLHAQDQSFVRCVLVERKMIGDCAG